MTDNNIYRKILKTVSLDDLLKGVPSSLPPKETLLPPAVSPPAGLEEKTQPFENSEKVMDQRPNKLFEDITAYRKFGKSDFGNFKFPFLKKLNKLDYAQLVASGTARRVERTLMILRVFERADDTTVYLENIFGVAGLKSLLSFSNVSYEKCAP